VGGVNDPVEGFGGVGGDRQQADVVDADQVGSHQLFAGPSHGVIGAVTTDDSSEGFETEP